MLATLIVAPAMVGGPLALILSMYKIESASSLRRTIIYLLSTLSSLSGIYLVAGNISNGATIIGVLGILTSILATWRVGKKLFGGKM